MSSQCSSGDRSSEEATETAKAQVKNPKQSKITVSEKTSKTTAESRKPNKQSKGAVPTKKKKKDQQEATESEGEEDHSQSEGSSSQDDPDDQRIAETNAFRRKPLDRDKDYNPDGTEKFIIKTRLMLKLQEIDTEGEQSDEGIDNSFGENCSDDDSEDEDDDEDEEGEGEGEGADGETGGEGGDDGERKDEGQNQAEEEGDEEEEEADYDEESPEPSPLLKKKKKIVAPKAKKRIKTIFDRAQEPDSPDVPKKKFRKNVMNVACTEYDIVKRVAKKILGYRAKEIEEDHEGAIVNEQGNQKLSTDWDITWHDLGITADFLSKMQPYQKVNQFPGMYVITRKNYLARNLMKMQRAFPQEYKFFPKTWLIPQEASDFRKQFVDKQGKPIQKKKTYIVKPEGLSQGQGIYLSRNCEKIIENCTAEGGFIVQDYLDKPHLVDDLKYDLRIYVMLYGCNPMRIYIHEQGLARFATEPYVAPKASNLDNLFMHLTNYAINKNNSQYVQGNGGGRGVPASDEESEEGYGSDEEESGHKRSLNAILKILYQQGADADKILDEIKDIVVKTLIVGQPYMSHIYRSCQPDDYDNSMCFQILGFDIMIDRNFKPWLIEVNQSPSFATDSPLDHEVKKQVLRDAFKLLNVNQERRHKFIKMKQKQMAERILTGKQDRIEPEARKRLMEQRLAERFDFENKQMSRDRVQDGPPNNYELIFPDLYDEDRNAHYEHFIKKANDIWDEFTTGAKGKKRQAEMAAEKEKVDLMAKKMQQMKKEGKGNVKDSNGEQLKKKSTLQFDRQKTKNQVSSYNANTNTQLTQNTEKSDDDGSKSPNDNVSHNDGHAVNVNMRNAQHQPQQARLGQSISGVQLNKLTKSGVSPINVVEDDVVSPCWKANNTADNFNPASGPGKVGLVPPATGGAPAGHQAQREHQKQSYVMNAQNRNKVQLQQQYINEESAKKFSDNNINVPKTSGNPSRLTQPGGQSGGAGQLRESEMRTKQQFFSSNHVANESQRDHDMMQNHESGQIQHMERRNLRSSQRRSNNNAVQSVSSSNQNNSNAFPNFQSFASYKDQQSLRVNMEELRVADQTPLQAPANPSGSISGEYPSPIDPPFHKSQLSFDQPNQSQQNPKLSQRDRQQESQGSSLHMTNDGNQKSRMSLIGNQQAPQDQSMNNLQLLRDLSQRHNQKQIAGQSAASSLKPPSRVQGDEMSTIEQQSSAEVPSSTASRRPKRVVYPENADRKAAELVRSAADPTVKAFAGTFNAKQAPLSSQATSGALAHNANFQQLFGNKHYTQATPGTGPFAAPSAPGGPNQPSQQQLNQQPNLNNQLYQHTNGAANTTYKYASSQIPQNIFTHPSRQQNYKAAAAQNAQGQVPIQYAHKTPQQKASSKFPGLTVPGARHQGNSGVAIPNQNGGEPYHQTLAHNNRVMEKNGAYKQSYSHLDPNAPYRANQQANLIPTPSLIRQQIGSTVIASNPGGYNNELTLQHMNGMEMNMHFNSNLQHMLQMGYSNQMVNGQLNSKMMRKDTLGQLSNQSLHQKPGPKNGHVPNMLMGPGSGNYKHALPLHEGSAGKNSIQSYQDRQERKAHLHAGQNIMQNSQKLDIHDNYHSPYQNLKMNDLMSLDESPTTKQKHSQLSAQQNYNASTTQNIFYQHPTTQKSQSKTIKSSQPFYKSKERGVKDDVQLLMHLNKCTQNGSAYNLDPKSTTFNAQSIAAKGLKFENQNFLKLTSNSNVLKNKANTSFLVPQQTNFNPNRRTCK